MGWVWKDDNSDDVRRDNSSERCATTKVVKSQCRTEEVETGKFVRKCEKTEEILRNCIGKPAEVLQSNKEYTEEDITDEVLKGRSVPFSSSDGASGVFDFPGLQNDIEVMERNLLSGLSHFFDAANGFFDVFSKSPSIFDAESSSPSVRRGIPIEEYRRPEAYPKSKEKESGDTDFVAMAKDV
ncbi:hypothetical protein AAZX31_03G184100 [Glycine max]|uniref:Mal d 1-associated protein n=1 Tax=Glycine soja TaxID=3848 RepID=A0A0B2QM78_GLYSO|nr:uncharacterized protein LOC114407283 [Glycine soja]KAG5055777.1 hypothetical protein JHK85_008287 [Glycine max]KHN22590.1 hypothetical protein glysoja_037740 [Glycine soja]RZC21629.1 hypothetical protein D0Y65_007730 [Glycine soja]